MHLDYLTARHVQLDAEYQQLRRQLADAQQQVQTLTTQGMVLEGRLTELAYLIDQETPAIPLEDLLPAGATVEVVKQPSRKRRATA